MIEKVSEAASSIAKEVTGLLETEETAVTSHEMVPGLTKNASQTISGSFPVSQPPRKITKQTCS